MPVEVIHDDDPYVFLRKIEPDVSETRKALEHQAGIRILKEALFWIGLNFSDYFIMHTESGKPYFIKKNETWDLWVPYFNISHCREYVACAISRNEIGCDIEKIRPVSKYLHCELERVRHITKNKIYKEDKDKEDMRMWTIYEALAKCAGSGIPVNERIMGNAVWNISSWMVRDGFILSVVQKRNTSK